MTEHPILFSGPMVRAILSGRKTQTRRVVKGTALEWLSPDMFTPAYVADPGNYFSPYGYAGNSLWVRETWCKNSPTCDEPICYRASAADESGISWKPSIHMPRSASRLDLEVVNIRIQRLWEINEFDCQAEGVYTDDANEEMLLPKFIELWNSINTRRGYAWESNPWVWAVEFKRITK